ncbi:MAG: hypothetical protein O2923_09520 [Verrucomicrobia bacterium]|nr:hypothetical protein [Verrucomicrobiota bacterium]MDA1086516.1 hypothetical protein [Verrucomicrobiota bacterium]
MSSTPRELVYETLEFRSPSRPPRQLWALPIAEINHPDELAALHRDFPPDWDRDTEKIFMHSDGHILEIYPDLVEIGIDAVNSQIFCMGIDMPFDDLWKTESDARALPGRLGWCGEY